MEVQKDVQKGQVIDEERSAVWRRGIQVVQIVMANAVPVIGVWFYGWQALRPIFFYWLDGLLALWGLGIVATVVTCREDYFRASGAKLWLFRAGVSGLVLAILAVPSIVTAMYIFASSTGGARAALAEVLANSGVWFSIVLVICIYSWQTVSEIRWKPELTLKESGKERGNLFLHRTLMMGLLVFWERSGQPTHWALSIYVLLVAGLYTFTQLYPQRYLQMIGMKKSS